MFQTYVEVRTDIWERRGRGIKRRGCRGSIAERRHYGARPMGSAFRPNNSEGLDDVRNKNWAKGLVMRGLIKSSG